MPTYGFFKRYTVHERALYFQDNFLGAKENKMSSCFQNIKGVWLKNVSVLLVEAVPF